LIEDSSIQVTSDFSLKIVDPCYTTNIIMGTQIPNQEFLITYP